MADLASKYKTYRIITPFRNKIFTSDPANIEHILKTNFQNYGKGWYNYCILKDLLGEGIFTVDGEKALRDISSTVFKENGIKLANIISQAVTSNQPMDIQNLFMKSTMDSISMRYVEITWKIKKALNIGSEAKLKKNIGIIDKFVYKLIHSKTAEMEQVQDDHSDLKKKDIRTRFLKLLRADPNFVIAGKDTTASTLSWFFYMLCKHPLVQEKASREIKRAVASLNYEQTNFFILFSFQNQI
ncbi:cytochrome P450, partial [Striga asiatica]